MLIFIYFYSLVIYYLLYFYFYLIISNCFRQLSLTKHFKFYVIYIYLCKYYIIEHTYDFIASTGWFCMSLLSYLYICNCTFINVTFVTISYHYKIVVTLKLKYTIFNFIFCIYFIPHLNFYQFASKK